MLKKASPAGIRPGTLLYDSEGIGIVIRLYDVYPHAQDRSWLVYQPNYNSRMIVLTESWIVGQMKLATY